MPPKRQPLPLSRVAYKPPQRKSSGGFGKFLLFLLLTAGVAFGYLCYKNNETPQQVWQGILAKFTQPAPTLIPAPTPSLPPPPTPEPNPIPTPPPEPTPPPMPPPDALAWVLEHKDHWPKEVIVNKPVGFPIVFNGRVSGSAEAPAGRAMKLVEIVPPDVALAYGGGGAHIPIASTDLRQQSEVVMKQFAAEVAAKEAAARVAALATPVPSVAPDASPAEADDLLAETAKTGAFTHPGLLHNEEDFKRMRTHQGREPWKSGWERLIANRHAALDWKPRPVENVVRGRDRLATAPENYVLLFNDIAAAYACALRWRISGERAYAEKSIEIMNAWSSTLKKLSGSTDVDLAAGIYGYEFADAAEIMRTYKGWKPDDFARFQKMMLEIFLPINEDFLKRHNNARIDHYWANWDLCNMASMMAIGVLCDQRNPHNEAIRYYKYGKGNGAIKNAVYCIHPDGLGQWQEAGRDQGHTVMGIGLVGAICEMAWKQGDDLYGYDNNRFLAGCEYVAKYNLGEDVPYKVYTNSDVTQKAIGDKSRGDLRPVWELVYNHYVKRKGLAAPYTARMAEKVRPEGGGGDYGPNSGGFDQLGYGTLTATLD